MFASFVVYIHDRVGSLCVHVFVHSTYSSVSCYAQAWQQWLQQIQAASMLASFNVDVVITSHLLVQVYFVIMYC